MGTPEDPSFTADEVARVANGLRAEAGVPDESFGLDQFLSMVGDEIALLRAKGVADGAIAALIGRLTGKTVAAEALGARPVQNGRVGNGAAAPEPASALDLPPAETTPAVEAFFAKCRQKIGFVPNVLLAYAHDMAKLQAFIDMSGNLMLARSGLSKLEREMIAVVVSVENHCHYCVAAHGAAVRAWGSPELGDTLVANYRAARLSGRQRAMLDFAQKLTVASAAVGETDREALRAAGFAERDVFDIATVAGFFNMSNRVASAVDMRPNAEYLAMARDYGGTAPSG